MELKLLTPPTDSPFRIQPTRGLPSEASFAVDTGAIPRSLPQVYLDPSHSTQPWEALARLGATGVQVSTHVSDLLLEAEARKNEANDVAEASGLYTQMVLGFDQTVDQLKVSQDHRSLRPAFDKAWNEAATAALAEAPNARVQDRLGLKLAGYKVTKSAEISEATTKKFMGYQNATLDTDLEVLQKKATDALPGLEQDRYMRDIETRFLEASHSGVFPADVLVNKRQKLLGDIKNDRAKTDAYLNPIGMLERISRGEMDDFSKKEQLTLMQEAENRVRTLRSDQENADARKRREATAEQDDKAIGWRQRVSANYATGGPGVDLSQDISGDARNLGKENYATLLEMHRTYRDRFLDPGKAKKSDPDVVGAAQYAIVTGRTDQITQADLLRSFKAQDLDEGDYTRLSNQLDAKLQHQKTEGKQAKTEAEKFREQQTKDAEKNIDAYLTRGDRFSGDIEAKRTDILIRDATTELHLRLQADPNANPLAVADELIKRRMTQADLFKQTLPYTDQADVMAAFVRGDIDKATATRYFQILEDRKKAGTVPGAQAAPVEKKPGLLEGVKDRIFGNPDPNATRAPKKAP